MKINPLFKNFLATTDEQKRGLEEQILKDGKIIYPLVVGTYPDENGEIQEYIIDGHNRYDIAIKHNLSYEFTKPIEFESIGMVYEWIFNQQKNKRNWNEWQEFEAVKKLKEVLAEIGKLKRKETEGRPTKLLSTIDSSLPKHNTQKAIAEKIGWSTGKVAMAEVVAKNAPVEIIRQLQKQEISIHEAYQEVKKEHNHRAQGTGENEWYTPKEYVDAVKIVFKEKNGIELDPASSLKSQEIIEAKIFYTKEDNGLSKDWNARTVFMNPPYSQPDMGLFIDKIVDSYSSGKVKEAIVLTHNYTDSAWFHKALTSCNSICFTKGRIAFVNPEGKKASPTQGQAFFYFGEHSVCFGLEFMKFGTVIDVRRP